MMTIIRFVVFDNAGTSLAFRIATVGNVWFDIFGQKVKKGSV